MAARLPSRRCGVEAGGLLNQDRPRDCSTAWTRRHRAGQRQGRVGTEGKMEPELVDISCAELVTGLDGQGVVVVALPFPPVVVPSVERCGACEAAAAGVLSVCRDIDEVPDALVVGRVDGRGKWGSRRRRWSWATSCRKCCWCHGDGPERGAGWQVRRAEPVPAEADEERDSLAAATVLNVEPQSVSRILRVAPTQ